MVISLWAITVLSLYIRVQVNILGRHMYVDTARGLGSSHLLVRPAVFDYRTRLNCFDRCHSWHYYLSHFTIYLVFHFLKIFSSRFGLLQMVLEPDTGAMCQRGRWTPRGVDCGIPRRLKRGTKHSL